MLKDLETRAQLEQQGWVIVDFFTPEEIDHLVGEFEALHPFETEGLFFSNRSADEAYKSRVQTFMRELYASKIDEFFQEAEWIEGVFIIKAPGAAEFTNHQDWSLVDENQQRSLGIWAPMLDVSASNGSFCVLSGSHRFFETYRSPTIPSIFAEDRIWEVIDRHRQTLSVQRGQALVFDHALIHATTANQSDRRRGAAFVGIKPKEAEMRFYWMDPDRQRIEAFRIDADFLYQYDYQSRPDAPSLGYIPWVPQSVDPEALEAAIQAFGNRWNPPQPQSWWRRLLSSRF